MFKAACIFWFITCLALKSLQRVSTCEPVMYTMTMLSTSPVGAPAFLLLLDSHVATFRQAKYLFVVLLHLI